MGLLEPHLETREDIAAFVENRVVLEFYAPWLVLQPLHIKTQAAVHLPVSLRQQRRHMLPTCFSSTAGGVATCVCMQRLHNMLADESHADLDNLLDVADFDDSWFRVSNQVDEYIERYEELLDQIEGTKSWGCESCGRRLYPGDTVTDAHGRSPLILAVGSTGTFFCKHYDHKAQCCTRFNDNDGVDEGMNTDEDCLADIIDSGHLREADVRRMQSDSCAYSSGSSEFDY